PQSPTLVVPPGASSTARPSTRRPATLVRSRQPAPLPSAGTRSARKVTPVTAPPRMLQCVARAVVPPGVPASSTQPATPSVTAPARRPVSTSDTVGAVVPVRTGPPSAGPTATGATDAEACTASTPVSTQIGLESADAATEPASAAAPHTATVASWRSAGRTRGE